MCLEQSAQMEIVEQVKPDENWKHRGLQPDETPLVVSILTSVRGVHHVHYEAVRLTGPYLAVCCVLRAACTSPAV
jgi:hypothetical protein